LQVELENMLKRELCSRLGSEIFIKEVYIHLEFAKWQQYKNTNNNTKEFYHVDKTLLGIFSSDRLQIIIALLTFKLRS